MPDQQSTPAEEIAEAVSLCRREGIQDAEDYAARILTHLSNAGFVVVPRKATYAMRLAGPPRLAAVLTYRDMGDIWGRMVKTAGASNDR